MSQIILDFGSGNTCHNDISIIKEMIDRLAEVDTGKHEVIIKWQLFKEAPPNIPLDHAHFEFAYQHAKAQGYETTSSIFDKESLDFLLRYDVPFIKIPCRPELYYLAGKISREKPVYTSHAHIDWSDAFYDYYLSPYNDDIIMCCIPQYPVEERLAYSSKFPWGFLKNAISDHTIGFKVFNKYKPRIWEKHYVLKKPDPDNPDAGPFAVTPEELKEIL